MRAGRGRGPGTPKNPALSRPFAAARPAAMARRRPHRRNHPRQQPTGAGPSDPGPPAPALPAHVCQPAGPGSSPARCPLPSRHPPSPLRAGGRARPAGPLATIQTAKSGCEGAGPVRREGHPHFMTPFTLALAVGAWTGHSNTAVQPHTPTPRTPPTAPPRCCLQTRRNFDQRRGGVDWVKCTPHAASALVPPGGVVAAEAKLLLV